MSTAIALITESTDHYTYSIDEDLNAEQAIAFIKERLGEEAAYISNYDIVLSNGSNVRIDLDVFLDDE